MAEYSIKDVETLTGIKAHTLRVWEKRYGFTNPGRTETNIRTYKDDEIRRLLSVSILYNQGFKVSKIAALDREQLTEKILSLNESLPNTDSTIEGLILAMIDLDEERFEKIFNSSILKIGFEDTITKVIYPFMERIGVLWMVGTIHPSQEHFVSNIVRQKLIVAIDAQDSTKTIKPSFLLFLREGELHELGLLFFYYLIKKSGYKVIYLGQNVPTDDLFKVIQKHQPDFLLTSFIAAIEKSEFEKYLNNLLNNSKQASLFISGAFAAQHQSVIPKTVTLLQSAAQFKSYLANIKG
jgi:DNA-binding transcriptional MerR regulator/methylmalonyl-CoA mutase cobalamin-binding subunit